MGATRVERPFPMNNAVPQRASKVMRSLEILRGQDEFRLQPLDEAVVLDSHWKIGTLLPF